MNDDNVIIITEPMDPERFSLTPEETKQFMVEFGSLLTDYEWGKINAEVNPAPKDDFINQ